MSVVLIAGRHSCVSNYAAAVVDVGAFPYVSLRREDAFWCDALLLPGGGDLSPAVWGEQGTGSSKPDYELDSIQFAMLHIAVQRAIPVLGICKGHQLVHVYFGGTLFEHLDCADSHSGVEGRDRYHPVKICPNSFLSDCCASECVVNSCHHQGIHRPGSGMRTAAYWQQDKDMLIEASEHVRLPIVTTQWHPERLMGRWQCRGCADGSSVFSFFLRQGK